MSANLSPTTMTGDSLGPEAFTRIASGLHHPEAIVWDAERSVLYAGGEAGEIYRITLDGDVEQIASCGAGSFVLGLALDAEGNIYVCERGNRRVLLIDIHDLGVQEISRGTVERPMVCPNYPSFDDFGRLLVSDSGTWGNDDGVIYCISPNTGTSIWSNAPSGFTNGMAFAPDRRSLAVVQSSSSSVCRITIQPDGTAGTSELIWSEPGTVPDGVAYDASGALYIGCYTPDSIYIVDPESGNSKLFAHDWSGQHLQAPTNLAFIGSELSLLASANLCGWHINATPHIASVGLPLPRPSVRTWEGTKQ